MLWTARKNSRLYAIQFLISLVGLSISTYLGLQYQDKFTVQGWQLYLWLGVIFLSTGLLAYTKNNPKLATVSFPYRWAMLPLLIGAFLLRFISLESVPGLLHVDETAFASFAKGNVFPAPDTTINPFITGLFAMPTLSFYFIRGSFALFGYSITALRLTSVIVGTVSVFLVYLLISEFSGWKTGLIAAILMAGFHYHIHWSRLALNNIWDTVWVPLMLLPYAYGWRKGWSGGAALAGFAVGMSQYFYPGARVGIFLLTGLILTLHLQERILEKTLVFIGKLGIISAITALPLAIFAFLNKEVFLERAKMVYPWDKPDYLIRLIGSDNYFKFFKFQLTRSLGAYTNFTDITGFYRPEVPFLYGLSALFFFVGLVIAIKKKQWLPVSWLALATFFGGFLAAGTPSSSHYVVSIPALMWVVALPLNGLAERKNKFYLLACVILVLSILFTDIVYYFLFYANNPSGDLIFGLP